MEENSFVQASAAFLMKDPKRLLFYNVMAGALSWVIWYLVAGPVAGFSLVVWLILHELGHLWAMKALGLKPRLMLMPPFGAFVMPTKPIQSEMHAIIASLGGMLTGCVVPISIWLASNWWSNPGLAMAAWLTAIANVLNLAPVQRMDGNQIFDSLYASKIDADVAWDAIILCVLAISTIVWSGPLFLSALMVPLFLYRLVTFVRQSYKARSGRFALSAKQRSLSWAIYCALISVSTLTVKLQL